MTIKKADGTEYKKVVTKDSGVIAHMTAKGGIDGFDEATGNYLRTPTNGLLPNVSGGSGYVGTSGWPFNYGYFKELYVNGVRQNFQFSTSEQWTGDYWIDGKKIYTKTIQKSNYAIANGTSFSHGISNISMIWIDQRNSFMNDNGAFIPFPLNGASGKPLTIKVDKTNVIFLGTDSWGAFSTRSYFITVRYTKTS